MCDVDRRKANQERNEAQNEKSCEWARIEKSSETISTEHHETPALRGNRPVVRSIAALINCHCAPPLLPSPSGICLPASHGDSSCGEFVHRVALPLDKAVESQSTPAKPPSCVPCQTTHT